MKELFRQFPNGNIPAETMMLLEESADYNADKQKPTNGKYNASTSDRVNLRRLEDIDVSWPLRYLQNVLTGLKINRNNSLRSNKPRELKMVKDNEGELVDLASLQLEEHKYSALDLQKWAERIPYYLRRLHDKSKVEGISLISLVIAYEKAKERRYGRGGDVKPGEILREGVYKMNSKGMITTRVVENKHAIHEVWLPWIRGYESHKDEYFYDVMQLLAILDRLKINMAREDPFEFQEDYMSTLTITYLAKNRDIILKGCKPVNRSSLRRLKNISITEYAKSCNNDTPTFDRENFIQNRMIKFLTSQDTNIIKDKLRVIDSYTFVCLLSRVTGEKLHNLYKMSTKDGFYMLNRSTPLELDVTCIFKSYNRVKSTCLIHSSGYLVLIADELDMYYVDVVTATDYLIDMLNNNVNKNTRYPNNKTFGRWDSTVL